MKNRYTIFWGYWPNKEYHGKLPIIHDGLKYYTLLHNMLSNSKWWVEINYYNGTIIPLPSKTGC